MGSYPLPLSGPHPRRGHGIPVFPWLSSPTPWQPGAGVSTLSVPSRALGPPHVGGCAAGQGRPGAPKIPSGALFILHTDPSWGPVSASPDPSGLWSRPCVVGGWGSQLPLLTVGLCVCLRALDIAHPRPFSSQIHSVFVSASPRDFLPTAPLPGLSRHRWLLALEWEDHGAPSWLRSHPGSESTPSVLFPTVRLVFWKARGWGALSAFPGHPSPLFTSVGLLQEACFVPDKFGVPEGAGLQGLPASSPGSLHVPCLFLKAPNPPGPGSHHTPLLLSSDFTLGNQRCCCWRA